MKFTSVVSLLLLILSGVVPEAFGRQASEDQAPAAQEGQVRSPNYRVGPADVLSVRVLGLEEYRRVNAPWIDVTVSNSGKVNLPYAGVLNVVGKTLDEVEKEIARVLRDRDLLKDPQVTVGVQAYRSHTVYLLGEVAQPGQYYMREDMHLMDLIALGLSVPTDGTMYLYRRVPVQGEDGSVTGESRLADAIPIDVQELAQGKRPELNVKLEAGDVLYYPFNRPNYYFVSGDVLKPGSFEMPPRRELMISEALSYAGGPTPTAKTSQGIVVRYDADGGREQLAVDFKAILDGRKPNFPVKPNDIIFIPGSQAKTFAQAFLKFIPQIALLALW
jgi:polysaccharide biosynthesis/export protein